MSERDPREGHPGQPGQKGQFGLGGTGGTGGRGGDPSGRGGMGGQGGDVYIDTESVHRWVRKVWIAYFALAVAMVLAFYIGQKEHDDRVNDNAKAINLIQKVNRKNDAIDRREAAAAIAADCARTRLFAKIAHRNGYYNTPMGRADLNNLIRHASRAGCTVK